jgi:hypothetical protein
MTRLVTRVGLVPNAPVRGVVQKSPWSVRQETAWSACPPFAPPSIAQQAPGSRRKRAGAHARPQGHRSSARPPRREKASKGCHPVVMGCKPPVVMRRRTTGKTPRRMSSGAGPSDAGWALLGAQGQQRRLPRSHCRGRFLPMRIGAVSEPCQHQGRTASYDRGRPRSVIRASQGLDRRSG